MNAATTHPVSTRSQGKLFILTARGNVTEVSLGSRAVIGNAASEEDAVQICLDSPLVSRIHGEFISMMGAFYYQDLNSLNGTWVDGELLHGTPEKGSSRKLKDGDVLSVRPSDGSDSPATVVMVFSTNYAAQYEWQYQELNPDTSEICVDGNGVGVAPEAQQLSNDRASFFHARDGWAIIDHGSTSGVFVNSVRISEPQYLHKYDVVRIAGIDFFFLGDRLVFRLPLESQSTEDPVPNTAAVSEPALLPPVGLIPAPDLAAPGSSRTAASPAEAELPTTCLDIEANPFHEPGSLGEEPAWESPMVVPEPYPNPAADADDSFSGFHRPPALSGGKTAAAPAKKGGSPLSIQIIQRDVFQQFKKRTLLKDIHLTVLPGEMVLILGGSGAGKTTFMKAVMGYEKAKGQILYGSTDIYTQYEQMKYKIGYVPQQDLLRDSDTVYGTLMDAAKTRLPASLTDAQRDARVREVMETLALTRERDNLIIKLSGGLRKRVSIGVELIADPILFFLDEPDSGLDGIVALSLMDTLRLIADQGKIVMVITHSPDRKPECFDKVIVLAKGVQDNCGHLAFFGSIEEARSFFEAETMEGIVRKVNRADEGGEGKSDYYIRRFQEARERGCYQ